MAETDVHFERLREIILGRECVFLSLDMRPILMYIFGGMLHASKRDVSKFEDKLSRVNIIKCIIKNLFSFIKLLLFKNFESLFISSRNNEVEIDGEFYDRVVDPLYEERRSAIKFAFSKYAPRGLERFPPELNITYLIYFFAVLSMPFIFLFAFYFYAKCVRTINNELMLLGSCLKVDIFKTIKIIAVLGCGILIYFLIFWLCKVRSVYVSNCYSIDTVSAIIVANFMRLSSYNIQHGVQHKFHYAFAFEDSFLDAKCIPKTYLCWDYQSAQAVKEYANFEIIGYVWEIYVRNLVKNFSPFWNGESYKKIVLISMQPTTGLISKEIKHIIKNNPEIYFLYRLHPSQIDEQAFEIVELFMGDAENFECRRSSKLPLPMLLAYSDGHLTGFSSVTLEAVNQDVPTIFFHEQGNQYYSEIMCGTGKIKYVPISELTCYDFKKAFF